MDAFAVEKLALVIARFADEHGVPNRVSPAELEAGYWSAPYAKGSARLLIGRLLRWRRLELNALLAERGLRVAGYDRSKSGHMLASIESTTAT